MAQVTSGTSPQKDDDAILLERIASRDREAFEEFFSRHERAAYSLAAQIGGRWDVAEEAVQEAMLGVWRSASSFQDKGEGSAKGWLLKIVANQTLTALSRQKKGAGMDLEGVSESGAPHVSPSDRMAHEECMEALQKALERLDASDRRLVALAYGAGFSQREISKALAIPQSSVSYQLGQALDSLRANLTRAGFAAATPLLGAEGLQQALTSGAGAPAGLRERVLEGLTQVARKSLRGSRRAAVAGAWGRGLLLPAGLVLATAAAGTLWWLNGSKPSAPVEAGAGVASTPPSAVPAPTAQTPNKIEPLVRHWNFNTPEQAKDFKVVNGSWRHVPNGGPDGSGCMVTEGGVFLAELDLPASPAPLLITFRESPWDTRPVSGISPGLSWSQYQNRVEIFNVSATIPIGRGQWMQYKVYAHAGILTTWVEDRCKRIEVYKLTGKTKLGLDLVDGIQRVDDLSIREIRPDELPDVRPYLDALEKIAPNQRVGVVPLSGVRSPSPGKPVLVKFYPSNENDTKGVHPK